jgi:hypothetical protein
MNSFLSRNKLDLGLSDCSKRFFSQRLLVVHSFMMLVHAFRAPLGGFAHPRIRKLRS